VSGWHCELKDVSWLTHVFYLFLQHGVTLWLRDY
jgi:hypothetical protein